MAVDKNKIVAEATRYVQRGQYDKAIKSYERILAEDRKEVRTLLKIGEIHQKKGDGAAAAATFNQVAEIYGEQGFFLKAVAVYKQIAKITPEDLRVNEKLAGLYQQLGLLNDATSQLQVVASAYEKSGDQGRHLDVLRRLLDLDPENVVTCQRLGDLYAKANRSVEALELYRRAAAHLRENKRGDEYVKLAERIYGLTPDDHRLARELAQEYLARGDTKKALGKLQVCHGADKQDADTLRLMAQAFRDLGQVSKTIAVYRALARVYAERGRREEAALTWRMVQELLPDDLEAKEELEASGAAGPAPAHAATPSAQTTSAPTPPPAVARPPPAARPPPTVAASRQLVTPSPPVVTPAPVAATPPPRPAPRPSTPSPAGPDAAAPDGAGGLAARILTETDVYLKYGLHRKALEHVQRILESDPENPDALERIRDVRDALGDRQGAAEAAERAVKALVERGDDGRIAHATERLRELDPAHVEVSVEPPPAAAELAPDAAAAGDELPPPDEERPRAVSGPEGPPPAQDDEAPSAIGAYSGVPLDEGPKAASGLTAGEAERTPGRPAVLGDDSPLPVDDGEGGPRDELDDHPGEEVQLELDDEPGPPVEIEAEEVEELAPEALEEVAAPAPPAPTPPPLPLATPQPQPAWEPLDAELEEVGFYERQGLLEEALLAVRELAEAHPGHPEVQSVLARIEEAAATQQGVAQATPAAPAPSPSASAAGAAPATQDRDGSRSTGTTGIFDLGAELSAELGPELTPTPTGEFQYSVADVFDQFKRGLEKTVRPDDSATKYDLGIAFQEMGMLDEALEQFRSALAGGDRKREVEILNMIGACLGLKGLHAEAVEAYRQALASEFLTGEAAKAVHFELGAAHEALGEAEQALWYFQKVAKGDPAYRGVGERVARLGGGPGVAPGGKPSPRARPASSTRRARKR